MVVVTEEDRVNHGGTKRNGQASHCRRCCATIAVEVPVRVPKRHTSVTVVDLSFFAAGRSDSFYRAAFSSHPGRTGWRKPFGSS